MWRALSCSCGAIILTFLLGCGSVTPLVVGAGGSMEREQRGQLYREVYTNGGYSYETVSGEVRYRMVQSPGTGGARKNEARKFKAELGRLADQIGQTLDLSGLAEGQMVLLPTTFVNLDDLNRTSTFGRLCAEQLAEELKKREFELVELRRLRELLIQPQRGELSLSREVEEIFNTYQANSLLLGTYVITGQQVVLSARLVMAKDNRLLGAGTAIFDRHNNLFLNSLLIKEAKPTEPQSGRPTVRVPVSDKYVRSDVIEEDLSPVPPVKTTPLIKRGSKR